MRAIEDCPYRQSTGVPGEGSCRLIGAITGVDRPSALRVVDDACRVCCSGPVPDPRRINPVLGSLVSRVAEEIIQAGGEPGCDAARAAGLRDWALRHLTVAGPEAERAYRPARLAQPCDYLGEHVEAEAGNGDGNGDEDDAPRHCRHPGHTTTTRDGCMLCPDWTDRPRPAPRPLQDLVPPLPRRGPPVRSWAVGITTAPRNRPTLDWTLDSLVRAGWEPSRIFEDGTTTIAPRHAQRPVSTREPALGAWPSYYLGLSELVLRHPDVDAYFMVQDDVVFYDRQDLRAYLEDVLWPTDPPGVISLYCSAAYTRPDSGWFSPPERWVWGALAFIFPKELARAFVADPHVLAHRWSHPTHGLRAIDGLIGGWTEYHRIPVHYPCPSLAQHIGDASTLWTALESEGVRLADRFLLDVEPD
jgi:hypothetical protein